MPNKKNIEDLTTEELGRLFPVEIVPYNKEWKKFFLLEKEDLQKSLGTDVALRIEHFGSTAIEGLASKPTIDILVEIPPLTDELKEFIIRKMKEAGYNFIWRTDDSNPYMNFVKGYTLNGFDGTVFHVHMGDNTHSLWDRIYFRDYLRKETTIAKEYEQLKIALAHKYKFNREEYTKAKSDFVTRITAIVKNT